MNFKVKSSEIISGLKKVTNIISSNISLPILNNVLLKTNKNNLEISSTDLDIYIKTNIPLVESKKDSEIAVSGVSLKKLFNKIEKDIIIDFELKEDKENKRLCISNKELSFHYDFAVMDAEDFPKNPSDKYELKFNINAYDLLEAIKLTEFCASKEKSRNYLRGIYFDIQGNNLKIVTTDAHRLALKQVSISNNKTKEEKGYFLPLKVASSINVILEDSESVEVEFSEKLAKISFDNNTVLYAKLLNEEFPKYKQVIPSANSKLNIKIDTSLLYGRIDRLLQVYSASDSAVPVIFSLEDNKLKLRTKGNYYAGKEEIEVSCDLKEQLDFKIAFNPELFFDILRHISHKEIQLKIFSETSPCIINSPADNTLLYLIMPMRV